MSKRALSDPCIHWEEYSSADWSSDLDLTAEHAGYKPVVVDVVDAGTGSLVVRTVGVPGSDTTWTVSTGDRVECRLNAIQSTTNVTTIRVGFSDWS